MKNSIKNPYYIVAPSYTRTSAGISLLYMLCDILNRKGYKSYIILRGDHSHYEKHDYVSPILSYVEAAIHLNNMYNPVVIYPDTGYDKLYYPCTFRYLMNYIGMFPGEPQENDLDFQINKKYFWAFSNDIAQRHKIPKERVMFRPIVNTEIFYPPEVENRKGKACYLGKYAELYSQKLPKEINKKYYIFYRNPNIGLTPPKEEYAEKLRNTELLYVYENTSVITDALMCGCPVVCMPNPYCQFSEKDMIGIQELGLNGIAIGDNPQALQHAKETVHLAREKILHLINDFDRKIDFFIQETQKISKDTRINDQKIMQNLECYFNNFKYNKPLTFSDKLPREIKRIFKNINMFAFSREGLLIKIPYFLKSTLKKLRKYLQ